MMLPTTPYQYLECRDRILPCFRDKAMWECFEPLRRLWDERYYATEEGEALLYAVYWRMCAAEALAKQGKRMVGDMA